MALPTDEPLEFHIQKTERAYVKLSLGIIAALCVLVAICWGGRRIYVRWDERKLMREAHAAFDKNDLRWAALAAQRAYSVDSASVDACRTLADIAEKQNSDAAIEWRRRALAIAPDSLGDRLALARTALHFQQTKIAAEALGKVLPNEQKNADFQSVAAHLALLQNDNATAGEHLREAARLAPDDPHRQLELAEFQLRSDDAATRAEGLALAKKLQGNAAVRIDALHVLLSDAMRHHDDGASIELAKQLEAAPNAPDADRLLALGIFRAFNAPEFAAALTRLETDSTMSAARAEKLIGWLNAHGLALVAIDWSARLPDEILSNVALRFALADSYVQLRDWKNLRALLERGSWDRAEPFRLALLAKVAHETGDETGWEKNWDAAVSQADDDVERLKILETLAFQWNWGAKGAGVLWNLADHEETAKDSLEQLYNYYAKERDTTGLYRALTRLLAILPNDLKVQNNFAQVALLLKVERKRALDLARAVHQKQPQNAAFASTYAFALYQNGDLPGALKTMGALSRAQLQDPSIAAYYGYLLAMAGRKTEATQFLDAAKTAQLLPEEERLVAEARTIISPPKPYQGYSGGT
jgi:Flp pilus assembly protein TadD